MAEGEEYFDAFSLVPDEEQPVQLGQIKWIPTKRGKVQPYLDGYNYRLSKASSSGTRYWRCIEDSCKAKLHTFTDGTFLKKGEEHHQGQHQVKVAKKKFNN